MRADGGDIGKRPAQEHARGVAVNMTPPVGGDDAHIVTVCRL